MAKPRIFVSSTYYDLKHVRSSLDIFIESLGYESVLSEKGDIAYSPDIPLDDSCYKEVSNADVFVIIVGGRYGSETSEGNKKKSKGFYDRYESVTKKEFAEAIKRDIPTYVLVEKSVYSEYHTYLRNKDNVDISYAHVDSVNIFKFIEEILALPRNNPTQTFEKFTDIESWLREQWSGLFRELLKRMSDQKQFAELSLQVEDLKDINNTLKTYLESVMYVVSPQESPKVIEDEKQRVIEKKLNDKLMTNDYFEYLMDDHNVDFEHLKIAATEAKSTKDFMDKILSLSDNDDLESILRANFASSSNAAFKELNIVREMIGLPRLIKSRLKASNN